MHVVMVRIADTGLVQAMAEMREWLDQNRLHATSFIYDRDGDSVIVRVGFKADTERDAFAARFGGIAEKAMLAPAA